MIVAHGNGCVLLGRCGKMGILLQVRWKEGHKAYVKYDEKNYWQFSKIFSRCQQMRTNVTCSHVLWITRGMVSSHSELESLRFSFASAKLLPT